MGPQRVPAVEASTPIGNGMRVVVLDRDAEVRAKVRAAIAEQPGFILAGESQGWTECQALLDRFLPELLIAAVNEVSAQFRTTLPDATFPVLVGLRNKDDRRAIDGVGEGSYDTLTALPEAGCLCSVLARVRHEICRRKADELSSLMQSYMTYATECEQYLSSLMIDGEGQTRAVAVEDILCIAADGNYVRVHTHQGEYEIRKTLTGISARLDPARFARVHRSFIVNLAYVLELIAKDASSAFVRLSNGREVPVGPNYREEFASLIRTRGRLTA